MQAPQRRIFNAPSRLMGLTARRDFVKIGSFSAALLRSILLPTPVKAAGGVVILNYLALGHPLLALLALFEYAADYKKNSDNHSILSGIAGELAGIANQHYAMQQQLSALLILVNDLPRRTSLDRDVRDLLTHTQDFQTALGWSSGTRNARLSYIADRVDDLSTSLSTYGFAAVPAYVAAITLQNSVHYVLNSPSDDFVANNTVHRTNLNAMLNETSPYQLNFPMHSLTTPGSANGEENPLYPLYNVGRRYVFALVSKTYTGGTSIAQPASTYAFGYQFNGFNELEPIFTRYDDVGTELAGRWRGAPSVDGVVFTSDIGGRTVADADIWFGSITGTSCAIPAFLQTASSQSSQWRISLDANGRAVLPDESLRLIKEQIRALSEYYKGLNNIRQLLVLGESSVAKIIDLKGNETGRAA